jgi:hypothetical protein
MVKMGSEKGIIVLKLTARLHERESKPKHEETAQKLSSELTNLLSQIRILDDNTHCKMLRQTMSSEGVEHAYARQSV